MYQDCPNLFGQLIGQVKKKIAKRQK